MEIIHLSAECYPVAKVGGLGDVVGALPKYQNKLGHNAKVVMPAYQTNYIRSNDFNLVHEGWAKLGFNDFSFRILREEASSLGFDLFVVHIGGLLDRERVYGYPDDTERFLAFQIAVLEWILKWDHTPDIIHCHDHHAGLVPFMLSHADRFNALRQVKTVLTIHNAQYQGQFDWGKLYYLPAFDLWKSGLLDWKGTINPLAAAVKCAWKVTTVSPGYLEEIKISANGLESLFVAERDKCVGILNGIDTAVWNPATDSMIHQKYQVRSQKAGKKANKQQLCDLFNLDPGKPLFTFIGRLVDEKGADLLPEIFYESMQLSQRGLNVLVLGSGDAKVEAKLRELTDWFPGNYNAYIGYNEELSHVMYAGADFLLMPSRVEPCGLNQMYALRYGTVPIVRRIGGLSDTIVDIGDGGFGFCHNQATVADGVQAVGRAFEFFQDNSKMQSVRKAGMQIDHSWDLAAGKYIDVYER